MLSIALAQSSNFYLLSRLANSIYYFYQSFLSSIIYFIVKDFLYPIFIDLALTLYALHNFLINNILALKFLYNIVNIII